MSFRNIFPIGHDCPAGINDFFYPAGKEEQAAPGRGSGHTFSFITYSLSVILAKIISLFKSLFQISRVDEGKLKKPAFHLFNEIVPENAGNSRINKNDSFYQLIHAKKFFKNYLENFSKNQEYKQKKDSEKICQILKVTEKDVIRGISCKWEVRTCQSPVQGDSLVDGRQIKLYTMQDLKGRIVQFFQLNLENKHDQKKLHFLLSLFNQSFQGLAVTSAVQDKGFLAHVSHLFGYRFTSLFPYNLESQDKDHDFDERSCYTFFKTSDGRKGVRATYQTTLIDSELWDDKKVSKPGKAVRHEQLNCASTGAVTFTTEYFLDSDEAKSFFFEDPAS